MKHTAIALLTAFSLSSCITTPPASAPAAEQSARGQMPGQWPRSQALEASWGPAQGPSLHLNGCQCMTYVKPGNHSGAVMVVYEGKNPRFPEIRDFNGKRASDGQLTVMGQRVDFYGSGNEDAEISTQPMQLTSPSGETGWFTFSFSSKEHLQGKNLPVFSW
jgi:hypothetical protein